MTAALDIQQLVKVYRNGFQALHGIDLQVPEGEFYALLGPNGAGKSTTISIVSSLASKTSGRVSIFGHDLDRNPSAAKLSLGVVPQEFNFGQFEKVFDILVTQAGYYGITASVAKARAEQYLHQLGLWDKRDVQSRLLSGGMKRRLMIARALIHQPRLLILDEPTAGVDIELRRSMWDFLNQLNQQGVTIILTTHYLEEAESLCRRIAIINQGRIVADTDMKSLLGQLAVETFILDLAEPVNVLPTMPAALTVTAVDPKTLQAEIHKSESLNTLFKLLSESGIVIKSMRNKANRLEELFVSLVENHRPGGQP